MQRPLEMFVREASLSPEVLRSRIVYGELHPYAEAMNLRGLPHQSYDGAGVTVSERFDFKDSPLLRLDHPNDLQALRRYRETYTYDRAGNLQEVSHQPLGTGPSGWTRRYQYAADSNLLLATSLPGDLPDQYSAPYPSDIAGCWTSMPHLSTMRWDFASRLQSIDRGGGGQVFFTYDATGQRVRKLYEHGAYHEERIYLGAYELYRKRNRSTGALELERQTLSVGDTLVETKTLDTSVPVFTPTPRLRLQLTNHLSTTTAELDQAGAVITYEETHPFGTSAFRASHSATEVSARRYRYTGQERDDETGLSYHSARYYTPWLGRWTAPDPIGLQGGLNLYCYAANAPLNHTDTSGTQPKTTTKKSWVGSEIKKAPQREVTLGTHKNLNALVRATYGTARVAPLVLKENDGLQIDKLRPTTKINMPASIEVPTPARLLDEDPSSPDSIMNKTWESEGYKEHPDRTRAPHVPQSGSSGVTLGRGYDMGSRSAEKIKEDLIAAGISESLANKYQDAAGKQRSAAESWLKSNPSLDNITAEQEKNLFKNTYKETTDKVASFLSDPKRSYISSSEGWKLAVNLEKLNPAILAFLVDLAYRGDLKYSSWSYIKDAVIGNDLAKMRKLVAQIPAHKKHFFDNYFRYKSRAEILGAPVITKGQWNAR